MDGRRERVVAEESSSGAPAEAPPTGRVTRAGGFASKILGAVWWEGFEEALPPPPPDAIFSDYWFCLLPSTTSINVPKNQFLFSFLFILYLILFWVVQSSLVGPLHFFPFKKKKRKDPVPVSPSPSAGANSIFFPHPIPLINQSPLTTPLPLIVLSSIAIGVPSHPLPKKPFQYGSSPVLLSLLYSTKSPILRAL